MAEKKKTVERIKFDKAPEFDVYFWEDAFHGAGYVGVPRSHPYYGLHTSKFEDPKRGIEIHGGVTWSSQGMPSRKMDERPELWYIGWDAAHGVFWKNETPNYTEFLKSETLNLAGQLRAAQLRRDESKRVEKKEKE